MLMNKYAKGLLFVCLVGFWAPASGMGLFKPWTWWASAPEKTEKEDKLNLEAVSLPEDVKINESTALVIDTPVVKDSRLLFESIIQKLSTDSIKVNAQDNAYWMASPQNLAGRYMGNIICPKIVDQQMLEAAHSFFGKQKYAVIVDEDQKEAHNFFKEGYTHGSILVMHTTMDQLNQQDKMKDPYVCVGAVSDKNYLKGWCSVFFQGVHPVSQECDLEKLAHKCSDALKNKYVYLFDGIYEQESCLAAMVIVDDETAYIAYRHNLQKNCKDSASVEKAMLQRCFEYMHHKNNDIKSVVALSRTKQETVFASLGLMKTNKLIQYIQK